MSLCSLLLSRFVSPDFLKDKMSCRWGIDYSDYIHFRVRQLQNNVFWAWSYSASVEVKLHYWNSGEIVISYYFKVKSGQ